jgi:hypothetical protein
MKLSRKYLHILYFSMTLSSICNFCIFFFNFDAQILKIHFLYFPTAGAYISNLYPIFSNVKVLNQWQVSFFFFFHSGICFRCRLDNPRHFPNFQLPAIGVTADFYFLHFLDNRRCSYMINFVQCKHNSCCK